MTKSEVKRVLCDFFTKTYFFSSFSRLIREKRHSSYSPWRVSSTRTMFLRLPCRQVWPCARVQTRRVGTERSSGGQTRPGPLRRPQLFMFFFLLKHTSTFSVQFQLDDYSDTFQKIRALWMNCSLRSELDISYIWNHLSLPILKM